MREVDIEKYLVRGIERLGGLALKWVSPGHNGVPDRIIILPHGRIFFVELKAPGKRLKPLQEKWREKLAGLGFKVYVIDSMDGVQNFIRMVSTNRGV